MTTGKRIRAALLWLLGGLVALEGALQLASWITWKRAARRAADGPAAEGKVILCVGDSFTWGVGASDPAHSYPSRLASLLAGSEAGPVRVVNQSLPGRNSREVLERLDSHLEAFRPALVYVLVGMNDQWSRPEPLTLAEKGRAEEGFPWRWRTGRLLALLGWLLGPGPAQPQAPAAAPPSTGPTATRPSTPAQSPEPVSAWQAIAAGEYATAIDLLGRQLESSPENDEARETLVWAFVKAGRAEDAERSVDDLGERYRRSGRRRTGEAWVVGLRAIGRTEECVEEGKNLVARFPDSDRGWETLAHQSVLLTGDKELSRTSLDRALELVGKDHAQRRAILLRLRSRFVRDQDPLRALQDCLEAYLLDGDEVLTAVEIRTGRRVFTDERLERSVSELGLSGADRERVEAMFRRAAEESVRYLEILAHHLRQVVLRSAARGARVVLLPYPMPTPGMDFVKKRVAEETGAGWVDLPPVFARLLQTRAREELFVADGHCNDAGYDQMAREVAEDARRRLQD